MTETVKKTVDVTLIVDGFELQQTVEEDELQRKLLEMVQIMLLHRQQQEK